MSGRLYVNPAQRQVIKDRAEDLADSVPPNMVEGLRYMLEVSKGAGLSPGAAYASVTQALRALQAPHRPYEKAWVVLEAGCLWLERESGRKKGEL